MQRLEAYPWPGNVREPEAVLEPAMIFKGRGWPAPRDLDLRPMARETADASHAKSLSSGGRGLMMVTLTLGQRPKYEGFADGWLQSDQFWGRPTHIERTRTLRSQVEALGPQASQGAET